MIQKIYPQMHVFYLTSKVWRSTTAFTPFTTTHLSPAVSIASCMIVFLMHITKPCAPCNLQLYYKVFSIQDCVVKLSSNIVVFSHSILRIARQTTTYKKKVQYGCSISRHKMVCDPKMKTSIIYHWNRMARTTRVIIHLNLCIQFFFFVPSITKLVSMDLEYSTFALKVWARFFLLV